MQRKLIAHNAINLMGNGVRNFRAPITSSSKSGFNDSEAVDKSSMNLYSNLIPKISLKSRALSVNLKEIELTNSTVVMSFGQDRLNRKDFSQYLDDINNFQDFDGIFMHSESPLHTAFYLKPPKKYLVESNESFAPLDVPFIAIDTSNVRANLLEIKMSLDCSIVGSINRPIEYLELEDSGLYFFYKNSGFRFSYNGFHILDMPKKDSLNITDDSLELALKYFVDFCMLSPVTKSHRENEMYTAYRLPISDCANIAIKKLTRYLDKESLNLFIKIWNQRSVETNFVLTQEFFESQNSKLSDETFEMMDSFYRQSYEAFDEKNSLTANPHKIAYGTTVKNADSNTSNSNASKSVLTQEKSMVDYNPRVINIIDTFNNYRIDLVKMMERPILADLDNTKVKAFYVLCQDYKLSIEENVLITKEEFIHLRSEFDILLSYSDKMKMSAFSQAHQTKLKDATVMLSKALNEASTDNEKALSAKGFIKGLEGILAVNEDAIKWLRTHSGLTELEA